MKSIPAAIIFGGGEGGGGGSTGSYTDLTHKPSINDVELSGNKSLSDLDLYSKTEVDDLLDDKADSTDVYTKTEADDLLDDKANASDVYTKIEVDNLIPDISGKADKDTTYTKTETDDLLDDKADSTDVYTKTETDDLLDDKVDDTDIVTSFNASLSDEKIPSEKLVKDSLDSKADKTEVDLLTDTLNVKKWNQIIKNGNFVDSSKWGQHGGSISVSNNVLTFVQSGSDIQIFQTKNLVNGHKYFCSFTGKSNSNTLGLTIDNVSDSQRLALVCDNEWHTCEAIFEANNDYSETNNPYFYGLGSVGNTVQIKNVFIVDLTDLYGAGNEPTAEEFKKMFPNEYYDYNAGTVINGVIPNLATKQNKVIETVVNQNWQGDGYNLVPYPYKSVSKTDGGITWTIREDGGLEVSGTAVATSYFDCTKSDFTSILPKGTYHISDNYNNDDLLCWLQFTNTSGEIYSNTDFTIDSDTPFKVACRVKSGATIPSGTILYPMLVKVSDDGTYPTEYQRYAMGNVELSNELTPVKINVTSLFPDKFIIDTDCSYRIGKLGIISFTAHITDDVINQEAFSYPRIKMGGMVTTYAKSATHWGAISSMGYLYFGPTTGTITVRMSDSLPYVHVLATVVFE